MRKPSKSKQKKALALSDEELIHKIRHLAGSDSIHTELRRVGFLGFTAGCVGSDISSRRSELDLVWSAEWYYLLTSEYSRRSKLHRKKHGRGLHSDEPHR